MGHIVVALKIYDVQKLRAGLVLENSLDQLQQATLILLPEKYDELLAQEYALLLHLASQSSRQEGFTSKHARAIHSMSAEMVWQYGKSLSETCMEYITDIGFGLAYDGMRYRHERRKLFVQLGASLLAQAGQAEAQQAAEKLRSLADSCEGNTAYQKYFGIMLHWCSEVSPRASRCSYQEAVWGCGFQWT